MFYELKSNQNYLCASAIETIIGKYVLVLKAQVDIVKMNWADDFFHQFFSEYETILEIHSN